MTTTRNNFLAAAPTEFRTAALRSAGGKIDRKAGTLSNVAIITEGEAAGHDAWIDSHFAAQVAAATNASTAGIKARFQHPSMSSDGLGKFLGRFTNATVDGEVTRGDLRLSESAHRTPDGDLYEYIMELADTDPQSLGVSIVFEHDQEAEIEHFLDHGGRLRDGYPIFDGYQSPDQRNVDNLPHVRLSRLRAADVVDEPAANPGGMFYRGAEIPQAADALLDYAAGLSEKTPAEFSAIPIHPDRLRGFLSRWLDARGMAIKAKKEPQAMTTATESAPVEPVTPTIEPEATETPAAEPTATPAPAELSDGQKFIDAFGEKGGVWFAWGKTYAEAQDLHNTALSEKIAAQDKAIADLTTKLADADKKAAALAAAVGDTAPAVEFADAGNAGTKPATTPLGEKLGDNLGRFATNIKLPGSKPKA